jgi:hypothetical protein
MTDKVICRRLQRKQPESDSTLFSGHNELFSGHNEKSAIVF